MDEKNSKCFPVVGTQDIHEASAELKDGAMKRYLEGVKQRAEEARLTMQCGLKTLAETAYRTVRGIVLALDPDSEPVSAFASLGLVHSLCTAAHERRSASSQRET